MDQRTKEAIDLCDDIDSTIAELDRSYLEAVKRNPGSCEQMDYTVADLGFRVKVVGKELARDIDKALGHLRTTGSATPDFTVEVWDEAEAGSGRWDARFEGWDRRGEFSVSADTQDVLFLRPSSIMRLDRRACRAVGCVRRRDALYLDERARPFNRPLSVMLDDRNIQLIHSGMLDYSGTGLLFVGKGGSGKTTCSIACFLAGIGFLGDDIVGLEMTGEGHLVGHGLYASCLIEPGHLSRFPELAAIGRPANHAFEDKTLVYLADHGSGRFVPRVRLSAVVLPRVVDTAKTSFRRAIPMEAMLALAPSSVLMLPGATRSLEKFSQLVTTMPAFWLEIGHDVSDIAPTVGRLRDEISD